MNIKNCPRCKKLFSFTPNENSHICPKCVEEEIRDIRNLNSYLKEHPKVDIETLSQNTEIPVKKITKYIRNGKVQINESMKDLLKCNKCGISISRGNYCKSCLEKISRDFSNALSN